MNAVDLLALEENKTINCIKKQRATTKHPIQKEQLEILDSCDHKAQQRNKHVQQRHWKGGCSTLLPHIDQLCTAYMRVP